MYVPEDDMSASKSPNVCCIFENFEHNQTRLKLNCVIRSTLYIQVEECLSESQYHHYAWGGVEVGMARWGGRTFMKCDASLLQGAYEDAKKI